MKKVLVLLAVLAMTIGANAQNRPGAGKDYNRVEIYYAPMFLSNYGSRITFGRRWDTSSITTHGFKAGYTHGFHLSKKWPMFIEGGANLQFNRKTTEETVLGADGNWYLYEAPVSILRLNIPVAFTWRFAVGSKKLWKISPYTGFNFGINLLYKIDGNNMFDIDNTDFYSNNRFQFGLIEGVNFTYKCWNFGLNYVVDLMPLEKSELLDIRSYTGTFAIGVGYEF
jgi:hypothetical protein